VTYSRREELVTVRAVPGKDTSALTMTKPSEKLNILYCEGDAEVVASQAVHIQKVGHQVTTAVGRKGVEDAIAKGKFDMVVLGPTLSRNDRHHLPYMVKKSSQATRVLVMHADGGRHPYVDANLDTGQSIDVLIETISSMLSTQKSMGATAGR
jgi:DNA-binding NtrC family response regulator